MIIRNPETTTPRYHREPSRPDRSPRFWKKKESICINPLPPPPPRRIKSNTTRKNIWASTVQVSWILPSTRRPSGLLHSNINGRQPRKPANAEVVSSILVKTRTRILACVAESVRTRLQQNSTIVIGSRVVRVVNSHRDKKM